MAVLVPPIKCQGIKTKLVAHIKQMVEWDGAGHWIEPFCGSAVVALNVRPKRALLADTNTHIVTLYQAIQSGALNPTSIRLHLRQEGKLLAKLGAEHYYTVRRRFNSSPDPHDFLFLSRACFNGVMRFNKKGGFNVPFCHKPERFSQGYVTKVANQVRAAAAIIRSLDWEFVVADFRTTLAAASPQDFVYADPPYGGRHTNYYDAWDETSDAALVDALQKLPCRFILSTWHHNRYRANPLLGQIAHCPGWGMRLVEHFYHVGPLESLRSSMTEALVSNYAVAHLSAQNRRQEQVALAL